MNAPARVFFTEDAYRDLVLETAEHPTTETGGILLGRVNDTGWYVVEVLDPGPRSIMHPAYFEYNHDYATHLANKVARRYEEPLQLLGLWHRHPGSFDSFSSTDDQTHWSYLQLCGRSIVSGLVNIDPDFRLTFYRIDPPLRHVRVVVEVGSRHFPPALLKKRSVDAVATGLRRKPLNAMELGLPKRGTRPEPQAGAASTRAEATPFPPAAERTPPRGLILRILESLWGADRQSGTRAATPEVAGSAASVPSRPSYTAPNETDTTHRRSPAEGSDAEKEQVLDLLDPELDWLDRSVPAFRYQISPQEPGYRLEVFAPAQLACPPRIEFVFYLVRGRPVVAVEGQEIDYQAGLLQSFYQRWLLPEPPVSRANTSPVSSKE